LTVCFILAAREEATQKATIMKIYGYIRVSTDKQTCENQRYEIEHFAIKQNITISEWIIEVISSTKDLDHRKLGKLIRKLGKGDMIVASELSRLGRNLLQIMGILNHCLNTGAHIWTIKDNYRLGTDIQSKALAFAFGLSAEIERNLISQRTKEALARIRASGRKLGRPAGVKNVRMKLTGFEDKIRGMLKSGYSKMAISRKLHVNRMTLANFIHANSIG